MTASSSIAHEPWSLDDYARRAMQYLFSTVVSEESQMKRRATREALLQVLDGIASEDGAAVFKGADRLQDLYMELARWQSSLRVYPVEAHQNDFDVVTNYAPAPETE